MWPAAMLASIIAKTRDVFGARPGMLPADAVETLTAHPVGGVCPFGLATPIAIYCDLTLRDFEIVYPPAGSRSSSVKLTPDAIADITGAQWIDVCTCPEL